jgi:hypothetical protein
MRVYVASALLASLVILTSGCASIQQIMNDSALGFSEPSGRLIGSQVQGTVILIVGASSTEEVLSLIGEWNGTIRTIDTSTEVRLTINSVTNTFDGTFSQGQMVIQEPGQVSNVGITRKLKPVKNMRLIVWRVHLNKNHTLSGRRLTSYPREIRKIPATFTFLSLAKVQ